MPDKNIEARVKYLEEMVGHLDGLVRRVALTVAYHLPSTLPELEGLIEEWNNICKAIQEEADAE